MSRKHRPFRPPVLIAPRHNRRVLLTLACVLGVLVAALLAALVLAQSPTGADGLAWPAVR